LKNLNIKVKKRNGKLQDFNPETIYKHIANACEGLADVYPGEIISFFKIKLHDKIKSTDIQQALILAAADLITEEHPNYQYVAARFVLQDIRKKIYNKKNLGPEANGWDPKFNYTILKRRIDAGHYDPEILKLFTKEEINRILSYIKWDNDFNFTYSGITQMLKKYLIKKDGEIIETPQEAFMLIPMYIFGQLGRDATMEEMINRYDDFPVVPQMLENWREKGYANFREALIIEFYNSLSNFELFLSTPPMIGIRSRVRGVTSCAGLAAGDSIESFGNVSQSLLRLITSLRAGIGLRGGDIRGAGGDINKGMEKHTGIIPYLKLFEAITISSQQPASGRSGQATIYYPWFHWEIEDIIVLKNNRGYDEKRVRHSDHAIAFNKFFYKKLKEELLTGETNTIALFHMNDIDDLYDEIGNEEYFEKKYNELVNNPSIQKRWISAKRLWEQYWDERYGTARIYKLNADDFQNHSAYDIPVNTSNLCLKGDTKVVTKNGVKEIKDIKVNDYVKSYNTETGKIEYKKVTASAMTSPKSKVMKITDTETGKHVICTPEHKIWTENRGYVEAKNLKTSDKILIDNGYTKFDIEYLEDEIPVYDITVEDNHNFFANGILVHNCLEIGQPMFIDEDLYFYTDHAYKFHSWLDRIRDEGRWVDIYKILLYKKETASEALESLYIRHPEVVEEFFERASLTETEKFNKKTKINFGEIFSCILGGINLGFYGPDKQPENSLKLMFKNMFLLNWFLDYMIDYQDYKDIKPFEKFTKERRALGISPGNLYYLLAQYGYDYNSQEARELVNEIMELMNYSGILSSAALAKYRGKCKLFNDTKYSKGVFPVDTYNRNVDDLVTGEPGLGENIWNNLRDLVKAYGMRNSTLFTAVPSSNSSRPGNMISGINPPQGLSYVVKDKKVSVKVLVPEVKKYKEFYKKNLAWEHDNIEYWKLIAVFQKWIDQSISLNQYVDYTKYEDERIPEREVLETDLFAIKYGIKTLYYVKPKTTNEDALNQNEAETEGCAGGGCTL